MLLRFYLLIQFKDRFVLNIPIIQALESLISIKYSSRATSYLQGILLSSEVVVQSFQQLHLFCFSRENFHVRLQGYRNNACIGVSRPIQGVPLNEFFLAPKGHSIEFFKSDWKFQRLESAYIQTNKY